MPTSIATLIMQEPGWDAQACTAAALGQAQVSSLDANRDGQLDYIVWHPCRRDATHAQVDVYLSEGDAYRSVLTYDGEALSPQTTLTNGFVEMLGHACDGYADCESVYFRWNGSAYQRYRLVRDQILED